MSMYNEDYEVFNPENKPIESLPVIYGFDNGGSEGFRSAVLIAEDGTGLGGHICSNEYFMYGDLGILKGYREDRHQEFRRHYPGGYRMDFVAYKDLAGHAGINEAFRLNSLLPVEEEEVK